MRCGQGKGGGEELTASEDRERRRNSPLLPLRLDRRNPKGDVVLVWMRIAREWIVSIAARLSWLPPLFARTAVGAVFVSTGWGKLQNLDRVIEFFRSLGIPAPEIQAPFVAATELSCGLLLVLGLATRFAALPLAVTMLVAIRTALWGELEGAVDLFGREEFLFVVLLTWLSVQGAGAISLDAIVAKMLGRTPKESSPDGSASVLARRGAALS